MIVTAFLAIPIGVMAGVYLEEYALKNWLSDVIEINVANLAGVPSIIYGLLAHGLVVYGLDLGKTILVAGMTLGLLILPVVIVSTREAVRSIPRIVREGAYGLGADKRQVMGNYIIPAARPGILTGAIVGLSRAIGETAPIITIGALTYIAFLPDPPISTSFPFFNSTGCSTDSPCFRSRCSTGPPARRPPSTSTPPRPASSSSHDLHPGNRYEGRVSLLPENQNLLGARV